MDNNTSKRVVLVTVSTAASPTAPLALTATLAGEGASGGGTAVAVLVGRRLFLAGLYYALSRPPSGLAVVSESTRARLTPAATGGRSGTFSGAFTVGDDEVGDLEAGRLRLRLHTRGDRELGGHFGAAPGAGFLADGPDGPEGAVGVWSSERRSGVFQTLQQGSWTVLFALPAAGRRPGVGHTWRLEDGGAPVGTIVYCEIPYPPSSATSPRGVRSAARSREDGALATLTSISSAA